MSERIDFRPLAGERSSGREDRVVRAVLERIARRPVGAGLAGAIVTVSRIVLPATIVAAVITAIGAVSPSGRAPSVISAARALGVSYAMERLIRQPERPAIDEMLNAFGGGR